jgi:cytochrome c-type biogenesis protein CcmH
MTTTFWVIAGLMALAAAAPLYAVLRRGGSGLFAAVIAVTFLAGSVATYVYLSDYDFDSVLVAANDNPHDASAGDAVAQLAARLEANPDDLEGWKFLGRSYRSQERYAEAADAFDRAYELGGDGDAALMLDLGEMMVLANSATISGRAGLLFENALRLAPDNSRALWYAGLAAANRGERLLAADRWEKILETAPPEDIRGLLERNIRDLRVAAGVEQPAPPAGATGTESPSEEAVVSMPAPEAAAAGGRGGAAAAADGTVPLEVTLSPELAESAPADAVLFIFARTPGVGGPPIAAVRRRAGELPLSITLSDANAMMAGRQLSTEPELQLVARVALGGSITESEGDLVGETIYRMDSGETAQLVIDEVVRR